MAGDNDNNVDVAAVAEEDGDDFVDDSSSDVEMEGT